ncbi:hypothetical protein N7454_011238 [Penicillium verhagenii]|nr:hypothetical protein N7454_011238 [Penicillium verhagenii]
MPPRKSNKEAGKSSKNTAGKSSKTAAGKSSKTAAGKSSNTSAGKSSKTSAEASNMDSFVATTKGTKKTQDGVKKIKGTKGTRILPDGREQMTHPRWPNGRPLRIPPPKEEPETPEGKEKDEISEKEEEEEEKKERVWDPERSYVGLVEVPEAVRPERQRWPHEGPPILDVLKIPAEWLWNDKEYDLDDE